jgi:hypothetical protein
VPDLMDILRTDSDGEPLLRGFPDPEMVVLGHSHVLSMEWALSAGDGPSFPAAVGHNLNDDARWDAVVEHVAGLTVAIMWNGNQHNAHFLLEPDPPFRVFDPLTGDQGGVGRWVPREAVHELFEPTFAGLDRALRRLTAVAQVVLVGTPPPKSHEAVLAGLERETLFAQRARELGIAPADLRVTHGPLRVSLWRIIQEMLGDRAETFGVDFIPVPGSAMSPDGYLQPELSVPDATHANARYGALVWRSLEEWKRAKST